VAKKKVQPDTWPKRDQVTDEDARQSSNDDARERARAERQRVDDDRRSRDRGQSKETDPDSAQADINRDDNVNDDV
jgi:hypothetical protein